jgi:hypothetical protein
MPESEIHHGEDRERRRFGEWSGDEASRNQVFISLEVSAGLRFRFSAQLRRFIAPFVTSALISAEKYDGFESLICFLQLRPPYYLSRTFFIIFFPEL